MNKQTILVLCGPPLVGKSTWAKSILKKYWNIVRLNRDDMRYMLRNEGMLHHDLEKTLTEQQAKLMDKFLDNKFSIIVDNTHCRWKYIEEIIKNYDEIANIKVVVFTKPLWLLRLRNVWRYITKGIWIPDEVIKIMIKNQDELIKKYSWDKHVYSIDLIKQDY